MHQINLQTLATELFKANQGISKERILDLFHFIKNHTSLEIITCCKEKKVKTVYFGTERISSLRPKKWKLFSGSLKNEIWLNSLKLKIKLWVLTNGYADFAKNT